MKRFIIAIVASLFCASIFAQAFDVKSYIPNFSLAKIPFTVKPLAFPIFTDSLFYRPSLSFSHYLLPNEIKHDNIKKSIVVTTSYKNFSIPTFSQPSIQTINWWQALGIVGMGLTHGLVFNSYNSNYTLDN